MTETIPTEPAIIEPKRKEMRTALHIKPEVVARFLAARDRNGTRTPILLGRLVEFFDALTPDQQAALIRGQFAIE